MSTSLLIKELCKEKNISQASLARLIGQTPQNFSKKLRRDTLTTDELIQIGKATGAIFEQSFTLDSGEKIALSSFQK